MAKVHMGKLFFAWTLAIGVFFAVSALFMITWNYTLPRLVRSVDSLYVVEDAPGMEYWTAVLTLILIGFMFPSARSLNSINTEYWYSTIDTMGKK